MIKPLLAKSPMQMRREAEQRGKPQPKQKPLGKPDPAKRPILSRD